METNNKGIIVLALLLQKLIYFISADEAPRHAAVTVPVGSN